MPISQKTLDFLVENRLQNSKSWFEERRSVYNEYVIEPLAELVTALTPTMLEIDGNLVCSPKIGKCLSRIYRDVRFSKDKSLFRDIMWVVFTRGRREYSSPGFFFELSPGGFRYGCGYCEASTASMVSARKLIIDGDKDFKKALRVYEKQDVFRLEGELYKRSRYPEQPENLRNWLDRKGMGFIHASSDFDLLFSDGLADVLADGFKLLEPVYDFLLKTEERV